MNKEINPEILIKKLSGKYADYYLVYEKLRNTLFLNFDGITIIPKTIYAIIDSTEGLLGVIFWKPHGLELAIKTERNDEHLHSASHLKYQPMNKMLILNKQEDINNYLIDILKENFQKLRESK
ncbi:hypothetical protein EXM33_07465 [Clostridium botulinum]|nr:hypothetical protein [Clostridium botulinum]NFA19051.1 hypothetical protein [Clostridium botulinum]NFA57834.1 hypothetical protein [Clostridium botulinum]NFA70304.1 hypothetical protein [Clostridium botulinum]NFA78156.1 hypothetical protein [Clostridium botulinum]